MSNAAKAIAQTNLVFRIFPPSSIQQTAIRMPLWVADSGPGHLNLIERFFSKLKHRVPPV
jgi:hypothetical protein